MNYTYSELEDKYQKLRLDKYIKRLLYLSVFGFVLVISYFFVDSSYFKGMFFAEKLKITLRGLENGMQSTKGKEEEKQKQDVEESKVQEPKIVVFDGSENRVEEVGENIKESVKEIPEKSEEKPKKESEQKQQVAIKEDVKKPEMQESGVVVAVSEKDIDKSVQESKKDSAEKKLSSKIEDKPKMDPKPTKGAQELKRDPKPNKEVEPKQQVAIKQDVKKFEIQESKVVVANSGADKAKEKPIKDVSELFSISVVSVDRILTLKRDFSHKEDYDVAVEIAQIYFERQSYEDAISWSLKAGDISPKEDDAWIIYAKSHLILGDKKTAKLALNTYLDNYSSKEVSVLLQEIKSVND